MWWDILIGIGAGVLLAWAAAGRGPAPPRHLVTRGNLAFAYQSVGNLGRAIPLYEQNLAARQRVLGQDHSQTKIVRGNLAAARQQLK